MAAATDFGAVLADERERALAQIAHLTATVGAVIESSDETLADDEHDPEGATIAFERAQVAALLRGARAHLDELDRAKERWYDGRYGICEGCREPIASERLLARPAATVCLRCAGVSGPPLSRPPGIEPKAAP